MPDQMDITENQKTHNRVLVVDRDEDDLECIHTNLEEEGYEVIEADDCSEASHKIETDNVDLMLLDVSGNQAEWFEFCHYVHERRETASVPIIAVTDPNGGHNGESALRIGADDFVTRPLKKTALLVRTRMLMRLKKLHDDLISRNEELERVNQELASRNRELEQGMEMAHRLQQTLLPQHYPKVENVSFYHIYTPADAIGGDLFQIGSVGSNRAVLFLCDVSGHGIRAALVTSILKAVFEHVNPEDKTPAQILADINSRFRSIMGGLSPHMYATAFLAVIDGVECSISLSSAGHISPFLISKYDMSCEPVIDKDAIGPALGFFGNPEYHVVERHLSPGDIVLGFTDGVYEVMNNDDEMFGLERLKQLLEKTARMIPRDIIERVIRETDKFRGSRKRPDDVCMVAAEMH
jgi:sigma-B regulation protein RsbU (phosphoserine phosphatase)